MLNDQHPPDDIVRVILSVYSTLSYKPPPRQFTILAAFALHEPKTNIIKVISLGTGSKCMPAIRLCEGGDALHDCHAEVIARRGATRWFLEEVGRACQTGSSVGHTAWLQQLADGEFTLREGVQLVLYVSTVPCGDASMRYLASSQDPAVAALKDSSPAPTLAPGVAARGRDNYSLYGVLRTKPGRADSPPTLCMSCSDKIACWNTLGIQGALGSDFLRPIYISHIIIGEVDLAMQHVVREDCERAFWGRLNGRLENLSTGYYLHDPAVHFTSVPFEHSRTLLEVPGSCNESLCWLADSNAPHEVLINGIKRGVSPKNRHNAKFRPFLSKRSFFSFYDTLVRERDTIREADRLKETYHLDGVTTPQKEAYRLDGVTTSQHTSCYFCTKQALTDYQICKASLQGPRGPFCGWVKSGTQWEHFSQETEQCDHHIASK